MKQRFITFLQKTGRSYEHKLFLELFRAREKHRFAVIKLGGKTLMQQMDIVAENIAYLQSLDLYPIIIHGGGCHLDKMLGSKKKDGLRITSKEDVKLVAATFDAIAQSLVEHIKREGGRAKQLKPLARCTRLSKFGYVGNIEEIDCGRIKEVIHSGCIPVISPLGLGRQCMLNINADSFARVVVRSLSSKKLIFLTDTGGVLDEQGQVIPFINLFSRKQFGHVTGGMAFKLETIKDLLLETDTEVIITSPQDLLRELFTIKGSGTFIKHYKLKTAHSFSCLPKTRIKELLEDAFNKRLVPDYFKEEVKEIIYEKDFNGVAILKKLQGVVYLDKLGVRKSRQGTGLGKSLWLEVTNKYHTLLWRAEPNNHFNNYYKRYCDGFIKTKEWHVYWLGLSIKHINTLAQKAASKPPTLVR